MLTDLLIVFFCTSAAWGLGVVIEETIKWWRTE